MGDSANILVGSCKLYTAPLGTTPPVLTANPAVWGTGWTQPGYTEDGVEFNYAPTFKDIEVDEEFAPVDNILTAEKLTISAKLAEATLANLNLAINASALTTQAATAELIGTKTLKIGSGTKKAAVMIGIEGKSPEGFWRVILCHKAICTAGIQFAFKKGEKLLVPVAFQIQADSSKTAGERLCVITDMTSVHTS